MLFLHKTELATQVLANPFEGEMQQMMRAVMVSGTGTHANFPGHDLAGKTGTTTDYKDAWFCGYTGGITTVGWTGRDDARPMVKIVGASAPSEIWRSYMTAAVKRLPNGAIPPGPPPPLPVTTTPVDAPAVVAPSAQAVPAKPAP